MTVTTTIFGALLAASSPVQAAPAATAPEASKSFDLARLKFDQCPGERFDFQVSEQTKVELCSKAGASKDEIAQMLMSAIRQLESGDRIRAASLDQIVAQIRVKLAEVQAR
ncbi:MAG: hypothetical protein M3438_01390 [Pseudomonadota bacterium]|nr:hypothetical protein [Sphingomonas sp.]MDQ3477804.1 hypothetical protein [Pseudomonadota bacterium]